MENVTVKVIFDKKHSGWKEVEKFSKLEKLCECGAERYSADYSYEDHSCDRHHEAYFSFCVNPDCDIVEHTDRHADSDEAWRERHDALLLVAAKKMSLHDAVEKKVGKGKTNDKDVVVKTLEDLCSCGAPMFCAFELVENPDMITSFSTHACLNSDCDITKKKTNQTCNMGGGPSSGNEDIYKCFFCF